MEYNFWLLRVEIITFLMFFSYIFYYLYSKFFGFFRWIYSIVWGSKIKKEKIKSEVNKVEIKEDRNLHFKTYAKQQSIIKDEDKIKISELLKRIKVNISKWEYDIAKNLVVEWLVIDKFNIELNIELASIYILEKDFLKAEYIYKDLLLVHTENFDILKKLAYILTMQEKYDLAIEMYKKAHDIQENDMEVVNMLASLYFYKKNYLESIDFLKIFLKENPRDTENLILLWASFKWIWKFQDAVNAYKRVLELQPYNDEIKKEIEELKTLL